jgi:MSHA pilin protein MshA
LNHRALSYCVSFLQRPAIKWNCPLATNAPITIFLPELNKGLYIANQGTEEMRKIQAGFTLIELVIVITIIGILGALALPRFAALQADARLAKMNGAMGAVKAAAAMAHAMLLTRGFDASFTGTPSPAIVIEGVTVVYVNGYPDVNSIVPLAGLTSDFVTAGLTAPRIAAPDSSHTGGGTDCTIGYAVPAATNTQPAYTVNATLANCT